MKETQEFYWKRKWKLTREEVYKRAGGLCENCMKQGIVRAGEIVHHIKHITPTTMNDSSIAYNPDNLILLCRECHSKEHQKNKNKRVKINEWGKVIPHFD